ncbi:peptidase family C78-domain-containing protein [Usnea florida]
MPGLLKGWLVTLSGKPNTKVETRLGTRELGRHAYENKMPNWLHQLLEDGEKRHLEDAPSGIPDILGKLIEQDRDVETAYLCHSAVCYVGKIKVRGKSEGHHFCGYHNIQMLASYLRVVETQGLVKFASGIPTIREIQDLIEEAWDQGFNEVGRIQTGGIKGTRKHIGTPEVCANKI